MFQIRSLLYSNNLSTQAYLGWMLVMAILFILAFYRPIGFVIFPLWAIGFAWLVIKRARQVKKLGMGKAAAIGGVGGGLALQCLATNLQLVIFPKFINPILGFSGVLGFAIAAFFSITLIRGWYLT